MSEKLDAVACHRSENEARVTAEKSVASLTEELEKAQQDTAANERAATLDNIHKLLLEYFRLRQYSSILIADLETVRESLKRVEKEKLTIRGHCSSLQERITLTRADADNQKKTLVNEIKCLRGEIKCLRGEIQQERDDCERQVSHLLETSSSLGEQIRILELQLAAANEKKKKASETREYLEQKRIIQKQEDRLADMEHKLTEGENLTKKLHNTIWKLKGNIRVFCRVRPLLPDDGAEGSVISYPTSVDSLGCGIDLIQSGQKYAFTFDKVFNHEASQQDVFVEISHLVQNALDGYKVCIFAYGQTGSGKTYTMMGTPEAPEQKGLIPCSLELIVESSRSLQAQGWKYKMQASMLEIYNETIRDLLSTNRSTASESAVSRKQYTFEHDANGNTYVNDLTVVDVSSITEISSLLRQAAQSRSVGRTQLNEQSSRSHMVFTLRISGVNEGTEQQVQGILNLIDLAGSQRLSRSGATGDRLKETQAINKSLSCLSDVIFALARNEDYVPFRNSKLTYLLQPCLGGDSKTLMFVNVSPDSSSVGESLCSLRFASKLNAREIEVSRCQMTLRPGDSQLICG